MSLSDLEARKILELQGKAAGLKVAIGRTRVTGKCSCGWKDAIDFAQDPEPLLKVLDILKPGILVKLDEMKIAKLADRKEWYVRLAWAMHKRPDCKLNLQSTLEVTVGAPEK